MSTYTYTVISNRNRRAATWSIAPSLPGVVTEGETVEEALAMARDAITGDPKKPPQRTGLPIPQERGAWGRAR